MPADTLAGLRGASEVQAAEAGRSGPAGGVEVLAVPALLGSRGHPGSLAPSSSQRRLLETVCCYATATGVRQRFPHQAEVSC